MEELKAVALTHKTTALDQIGLFHLNDEDRDRVLAEMKERFNLKELMYLSTCNRVEIIFSFNNYFCLGQAKTVFQELAQNKKIHPDTLEDLEVHNGEEALEHLIRVASSLDSMVIGEREIITQVRKSFENAWETNLSGDLLRMSIRKTIETAKRIYTETQIATKPVSTVSLAWHKFLQSNISKEDNIILIGAGQIIRNFSRFLAKHGYTNIDVYNRSKENAQAIADTLKGRAHELTELPKHSTPCKAIISCTGADHNIISVEEYNAIPKASVHPLVIDMSIPTDIPEDIANLKDVDYFGMKELKEEANKNIDERKKEVDSCENIITESIEEFEKIYMQRKLELALSEIPQRIKEIKETALTQVFAKELDQLDDNSRVVLEEVLQYMEKKYISVPMKMAREVMIDKVS